jgi:hypothetical protein
MKSLKEYSMALGFVLLALALLFGVVAFANAADKTDARDTRNYHNTVDQLEVQRAGYENIGPSATYWSEREMPLYIQNGCTEDVFHVKQACPF